jgi:RND family efflux transporter MFP subunit
VEKNVLQGQRVMAGDALYRIADLTTVWVEGEVFERDLPSGRLVQLVQVGMDALPGSTRQGRITYIYPTLNPETRTSRVRVALANPGLRLKPGMYATLHWHGVGLASALTVPRAAVLSTGQRHLLFVQRPDGMLEPRLVQIGLATEDRVQILSGVNRGDSVVRSATFLVDAESNLGTLLGGMGDMPGMDMTAPTSGSSKTPPPTTKQPEDHSAHANH